MRGSGESGETKPDRKRIPDPRAQVTAPPIDEWAIFAIDIHRPQEWPTVHNAGRLPSATGRRDPDYRQPVVVEPRGHDIGVRQA